MMKLNDFKDFCKNHSAIRKTRNIVFYFSSLKNFVFLFGLTFVEDELSNLKTKHASTNFT